MKKVLKLGLCGMMAVMLVAGCSKKEEKGADPNASATITAVPETDAEGGAAETSVKLGEYKGITYTPASEEVSDEDVEQELQALVDNNPVVEEVDRAAENGDTVNIDYVGKKDGVAFDGGTANGYDLVLGSGSFIDGFEDGLIGTEKGQKVSLDLTFPENYPSEELAGQAVVFEVTVNAVKQSTPAVLDDAFIASNTTYKTVEEYRQVLREQMEELAKENARVQKQTDVFQKVMEGAEVTVADADVQKSYDEQMEMYEKQAESFGMDLETMVGYYGMDLDGFKTQLQAMAKEVAKQNAVIKAIAEAENLTIDDSEKESMAAEFGYDSVDAMIENAGQETVENYLLADKVINFLTDNAVAE